MVTLQVTMITSTVLDGRAVIIAVTDSRRLETTELIVFMCDNQIGLLIYRFCFFFNYTPRTVKRFTRLVNHNDRTNKI